MEALHPQSISNALYGISGLFDESVPSTVIIYRYLMSHFDRVVAVDSNQLSFKDRRILTSHVCLFIDHIQHNGSVISNQLSAELIEMRYRLEPLRMLGLTTINDDDNDDDDDDDDDSRISKIEELYLKEFQLALQNTPYEVWSQAYLDGMECDLIITMKKKKSSPTCGKPIIIITNNDSSNSYHSTQTIVVNIEIDGPHHKQPKKLQYTRLRDEYFRQRHGVSVRRVDVASSSSRRRDGSNNQHVAEIVMGILKEEMKLI
jgi:hypothetical protein